MSLTTTRIYKSTDAGAPVLSGTFGSLIALFDAVLVGTSGIAYGTTPAAGWTKEYSATNKAAYRNNATYGSGCYARIDDSAGTGFTAQEARLSMFKSMTDVDTGTLRVPSVAQMPNGVYVSKSDAASATAAIWIIVADALTVNFELYPTAGAGNDGWTTTGFFGDYLTYIFGDGYNYGCAARTSSLSIYSAIGLITPSSLLALTGIFCGGTLVGVPTALVCGFCVPGINTANPIGNPAPITGFLLFQPLTVFCSASPIGVLRGYIVPLCAISAYSVGDILTGITGLPAGSSLVVFRGRPSTVVGYTTVQYTLPWDIT